jgi:hypothetical protein
MPSQGTNDQETSWHLVHPWSHNPLDYTALTLKPKVNAGIADGKIAPYSANSRFGDRANAFWKRKSIELEAV